METINDSNYELWLLRYAEDELPADGRAAVERWLAEHPEAAAELALYGEAPRLERDTSVRYAAAPRQHTRPLWAGGWRWAVAAAVALLLLTPAVLHFAAPHEGGVQVAQAVPPRTATPAVAVPDTEEDRPAAVPTPRVGTRKATAAPAVEEAEPIPEELLVPSRPMELQPVLLAEELPVEAPAADEPISGMPEATATDEPQMVYVDNLFTAEEPDPLEQRLLAFNDAAKESLQGFYLGRRLARRLPDDNQLLAMADEARERTPRGVRMVADAIRVFNDSSK